MTQPISSPRFRCLAATILLLSWVLLPSAASAIPPDCGCPAQATSSLWGELTQNTCVNLETNLYNNLRSWAHSLCDECEACFYSYTTHYPTCSTNPSGNYIQAGTLYYACGFPLYQ